MFCAIWSRVKILYGYLITNQPHHFLTQHSCVRKNSTYFHGNPELCPRCWQKRNYLHQVFSGRNWNLFSCKRQRWYPEMRSPLPRGNPLLLATPLLRPIRGTGEQDGEIRETVNQEFLGFFCLQKQFIIWSYV